MGFQQPLLIRNHCLLSLSRIFSGCGLEMVCKSAKNGSVSTQTQMGHLHHNHSRFSTIETEQQEIYEKSARARAKPCLLDMTGPGTHELAAAESAI